MSTRTPNSRLRGASGVIDQVFSSLSNGLILYAVAAVSAPGYFGLISIQLTLLAAAIGCLRGALGTSLLLMGGQQVGEIRREGSFAVTAALIVSPALAGALWVVDRGATGIPTLIIAIATPLVLVQDVLRFVVIAEGRPHVAMIWDGVWFLGSFALLVCTWLKWEFVDANVLLGGWAALALASLLGLGFSSRIVPGISGFARWVRTDWPHRLRYGIDSGLDQLAIFAILALVAVLVSPVVTAALRGATAILAPISMLTSSLPLVLIPHAARTGSTPKQVWRALTPISVVTSAVAMLAGLVVWALPDSIGTLLLGDTFDLSRDIIVWIALEYTIGWWALAIMVWLKTFNRSAELLNLKIGYVIALTGSAAVGAVVFKSATGVAISLVMASTLVATVALGWWAPWRAGEVAPGKTGDEAEETVPEAVQPPAWHQRVVRNSNFTARPVADFVRLDKYQGAGNGVSSLLIALWVFAVMGVLGPLAIIALTGPAPDLTWLGPLGIAVVAAARFSWIIGLGERRLFEIMFWSFTYPFMGLAPMTEVREQIWPIIVPRSDFTLVWPAVAIVALGTFAFLLGVFLNRSRQMRSQRAHPAAARSAGGGPLVEFTVRNNRLLFLSFVAIVFNLYYSYKIGFIQFAQSRQTLTDATRLAFPSQALAVFVRAGTYMSLLTAWVGLARFRREAKLAAAVGYPRSPGTMRLNLALLWVIGILLANSMNPISNARYLSGTAILAAAAAAGLFATAARFRVSVLAFLVALLVIFPIMDVFRYRVSQDVSDANPIKAFLSPDFDSFANVVNGYLIVQREGIHIGQQFLGVVAFWVPRGLWPAKPVDTGIYLAQSRGYPVVNLSAPLWIEMFMNGGFVVLIVAMFALGYFLHAWDTRIDRQLAIFKMPTVLACIVPFYMFILLRGSLLQAMPYLMVTVVCWLFVRVRNKPPPGASRPASTAAGRTAAQKRQATKLDKRESIRV